MPVRMIMRMLVMCLTSLLVVVVSSQEVCEGGCDGWRGGCEGVCQEGEGARCERCRAGLATHLSLLRQKMGAIPPPRIIPGRCQDQD